MAKCIVCNTRERAWQDEHFCAECRKQAEDAAKQHQHTEAASTVCDHHPSALAHWHAEQVTGDGVLDLCDHCARTQGPGLETAGWILTGAWTVCACLTCQRRVDGRHQQVTA